MGSGRADAARDFDTQLLFIKTAAPSAWKTAQDERSKIETANVRFHDGISTAFAAAKRVEQNLIERAAALKELALAQSSLADAKQTLENPASLQRSGEELIVLQNGVKFLPGAIQNLEANAKRLEEKVTRVFPVAAAGGERRPERAAGDE